MSSPGQIHKDQQPPPGIVSEQSPLLKQLPKVCWGHPGSHTPCPHPCPHSCPTPAPRGDRNGHGHPLNHSKPGLKHKPEPFTCQPGVVRQELKISVTLPCWCRVAYPQHCLRVLFQGSFLLFVFEGVFWILFWFYFLGFLRFFVCP